MISRPAVGSHIRARVFSVKQAETAGRLALAPLSGLCPCGMIEPAQQESLSERG